MANRIKGSKSASKNAADVVEVEPVNPDVEPEPKNDGDVVEKVDPDVDHSADADGDFAIEDDPTDEQPEEADLVHVKVFTLGGPIVRNGFIDKSLTGYDHTANITATRQYMIAQGLRPVGEVSFVGATTNADGESLDLEYRVKAVAAESTDVPEVEHAPAVEGSVDFD